MPSDDGDDAAATAPRLGPIAALRSGYDSIVDAIIRPPRADYTAADLGPAAFTLRGRRFVRVDSELRNPSGQRLVTSHWQPAPECRPAPMLPAVLYLHGNSACRLSALEVLQPLLCLGVTVIALDFSGSGLSEGPFVTLGWREKDDVAAVVQHLRSPGQGVSSIALWGRSMGAATALLHSHRDPSIAALVADSPFTDLKSLALELAQSGGGGEAGVR